MFKIEFFVDRKKLPDALEALVGIAHGVPSVVPVVNVRKTGNGLAAAVAGSTMDRFAAALKAHSGETINAAGVRAMMKPLGVAEKSYSFYLTKALKARLIRKTGKGAGIATKYTVV